MGLDYDRGMRFNMKINISVGKGLISLILLLSLCQNVFGQADEQLIQVANEMYNFGDAKDALEVFKQALDVNPDNATANYMAGKCYIETIHKDQALPYFLKAYQLNPQISENILYDIGHAYHLSYKFEEAVEYYKKYMGAVPKTNLSDNVKFEEIKKSRHRIEECGIAKGLVSQPEKILIENLGEVINSVDEDYAPVISTDESTLYFTSRRAGSTGAKKDNDNEFFEDIYVAKSNKGVWGKPVNIGKPVNSDLHDACVAISPDGNQLYIYKDNDKYKGDIFYCKLDKEGKWSDPLPMSIKINTPYIEKALSFSLDGKTIYFSSNRPGGKGGMDIYKSKLKSNGDWEDPINLGEPINSSFDDDCPFFASDNKTLYFSSKGHKGMGGFDVYKSLLDSSKNTWSDPENLKYPINSPDDDMYFVLASNSKYGYYASVKADEVGDVDIYRIRMPEENLNDEDSSSGKKVAKVDENKVKDAKVKNADSLKVSDSKAVLPVKLKITVIDEKGNTVPSEIEIIAASGGIPLLSTNSKDGLVSYEFMNKDTIEYVISAEKDGFIFKSDKLKIPPASSDALTIERSLQLEEVKVGVRRILKNVYFDYNQASIMNNSFSELEKLFNMLKENASVKVEIDGHTDSYGSNVYNIHLSQRRAEAVVAWLIDKGIKSARLKAKGYGEQMPLATNDDEQEGRELNRRTEFVILSK